MIEFKIDKSTAAHVAINEILKLSFYIVISGQNEKLGTSFFPLPTTFIDDLLHCLLYLLFPRSYFLQLKVFLLRNSFSAGPTSVVSVAQEAEAGN